MIDIHTHLLPGIDDGPATLDAAVAMARAAALAGATDVVATPHANEVYRFDPAVVEQKLAELQRACGNSPRIHYGCELHCTAENVEAALASPRLYCIGRGNYLLLEFSCSFVPKAADEILALLLRAGLRPVVAHPERNPLLSGRFADLARWVEMGCGLQLTAQSVTGNFGGEAKKAAERAVRAGIAHFVASDGHDLTARPPSLEAAHRYLENEFGETAARLLTEKNPRAALAGEPLQTVRAAAPRSWLGRLRKLTPAFSPE
jgi:protein-tyrosine phosphatase